MSSFPIFVIDTFTSTAFEGNPAAVCLLHHLISDTKMQQIAAEMNLSETAFVFPLNSSTFEDAQKFSLRWFTPRVEAELCGHATLAAAFVLFDQLQLKIPHLIFETFKGELKVQRDGEKLVMDFPSGLPQPVEINYNLIEALGVQADEIIAMEFCPFTQKALLQIKNPNRIPTFSPNFVSLSQIHKPDGIKGIILTAQGDPNSGFDFISRYFAPWKGVNEDPVTGSAHVVLAKYWSKLLNKKEFHVKQVSTRSGILDIALISPSRVLIKGNAKLVVSGNIFT